MKDAHVRNIDADGLNGVVLVTRVQKSPEKQHRLIDRDGLDGICSRVGTGRGLGPAQERAARLGIFVIGTARSMSSGSLSSGAQSSGSPAAENLPEAAASPPPPPKRRAAEITTPTVMFEAVAGVDFDMQPTEIGPWSPPPAAVMETPEESESVSEVVALPPGLVGLVWAEVEHEKTELVTRHPAERTGETPSIASTPMGAQLDFSLQPFSSEDSRPRARSKVSAALLLGAAVFATGAAGGAAAAAVFLVAALSWVAPGADPAPAPVPVPAPVPAPAPPSPAPPVPPEREAAAQAVPEGMGELTVTDAFSFAETQNETEGTPSAFVQLATELGRCPGRIVLTGHTCSLGPEEANLAIGLQRAATVRDHLVRGGFPPDRIEIRTEGSRAPIASNDHEEGRRRNRRVTAACNELTPE